MALIPLLSISGFAQDVEELGHQDPVSFSGSLTLGLQFFDARGRPANREPFMWYMQGNPVLSLYGITFPFSFTVSEQQREFRQPFNQFGVSPYYKWVKAHAGYTNVIFSPFTLGGHTLAGGGVELTPGKLRFGFMYGRLFRAVQAVGDHNGTFVASPSFRRTAASLKVGYGTEENFVDLIWLRGRDDERSVEYAGTDITPAENIVAGIYSRQRFLKRFIFEGEYAQSLYTSNADLTDRDTVKHGFLITPFTFLLSDRNISTSYAAAANASLEYQEKRYSIRLKYREVGPAFQSMGAYFFQNDLRNITVEPSVKLYKSALLVNGSFGYQTDNLDKRRASTTKRKIGSVHVNGRIGQIYSGNLSYSNYDIGQAAGTVPLDTLIHVSRTMQSWGTMHNLMLAGQRVVHNFTLNYNYQVLADRNPNTSVYTNYDTDTWLASYYLTLTLMKLSIFATYTRTDFRLASQETQINGPSTGLTKTLLKNAMTVNLTYSAMAYAVNGEPSRTINRMSVNTSYRAGRKHRLSFRFYINKSTREAEGVKPFREVKGDLLYGFTF